MGNICSPCSKNNKRDAYDSDGDDGDDIDHDDFKTVLSRQSMFGEDDVWHDALMEHDYLLHGGEEIFDVTDEEVEIIQNHLASNFSPEEVDYMGEVYIRSVASKPYSKDMTIRRPLQYSMDKLTNVLKWRKENHAPEMEHWIDMIRGGRNEKMDVDSNIQKLATTMVKFLNNGSTYFHGLTKDGRPVLWVRTNRKGWYPDADAETNALIVCFDAAIRYGMPTGVTDVCIIAHTYKPPPPHPKTIFKILKSLVNGYPDRMHVLIAAPVSGIVEFVMGLLWPLMPGRLAEKFVFLNTPHMTERLEEMLLNGADDIPTFLDGPVDHDVLYPEEKNAPSHGGNLKFDYYGMVQRLQEQRDAFEKRKRVSFAQLPDVAEYANNDNINNNIDNNNLLLT